MNALDTMKVPDPTMFDNYDTGGWVPPPQAKAVNGNGKAESITYTLTVPSADSITFRPDKNGFLMAVIDGIEIDCGNGRAYSTGKTYLSSAPFPKKDKSGAVIGTRNASSLGNFLRANGMQARPGTAHEYETYTLATAGQQIQATIEWEAYDSDRGVTVADRWEQFPDDTVNPGQKQPFIETDGEKRLWARAVVRRFVDRVS